MQPYLQVSLNVRGRLCVVVGGSAEAEERVVRLIEGQARVVVIAETVTEALSRWASQGRIELRARAWQAADLDGAFLVMALEPDRARVEQVRTDAHARQILFYAPDRPDLSDLAMPALVRRGLLRLAVSTGEASPALAGRLRAELERIFDERFVHYVLWLDELRTLLKDEEPDPERRAAALRAAVDGFAMNAVLHYPEAFRSRR